MAIQFSCPACGVVLSADARPDGPLTCPSCQAEVHPEDSPADAVHEDSTLGALAALLPWAVSIVFHVAVFLAALFIVLTVRESANMDRIVIPDARLTRNPGSPIRPAPEQAAARASQTLRQMRTPVYQKHAKMLLTERPSQSKSELSIVGIGAPGAGARMGLRGFGGGGPKASFLGSGGNAYKVVYVIDRSGSMIMTMDFVMHELRKSINALQPIQSFHVIFFSSEKPEEMKPRRLARALAKRKKDAFTFLDTIVAEGRTDPIPALQAAFRVPGGPPELIYFMTDGEFDPSVVARIRGWNRDKKVKINTIAFLYRSGEALLKQIARDSNGRYKFVSAADLGE